MLELLIPSTVCVLAGVMWDFQVQALISTELQIALPVFKSESIAYRCLSTTACTFDVRTALELSASTDGGHATLKPDRFCAPGHSGYVCPIPSR